MPDLISKKARQELREHFVGTTLREITDEFDAADIPCDTDYGPPVSGQRRGLVEQFYHSLDWTKWADVKRALLVYGNVLAGLETKFRGPRVSWESEHVREWAESHFDSLKKWIERDGYRYEQGRLAPIGRSIDLSEISNTATKFDVPELQRQIERARDAVEDDPGLAIGTAKEIVETTCKTILSERGVAYDEDGDLLKLVKEARTSLVLLPEDISNAARGAEPIKKILGSLGVAAHGLAELRNLFGTGHGKHGKAKGLSPRHARLAVGCAATLSMFLLETHEERKKP